MEKLEIEITGRTARVKLIGANGLIKSKEFKTTFLKNMSLNDLLLYMAEKKI